MSNFYSSTFYVDGYQDGYAAVEYELKPSPPDHDVHAAEYMAGWEDGLKAGRVDYWDYRVEQSYYDWQAGL